jgi:hypothetical protein
MQQHSMRGFFAGVVRKNLALTFVSEKVGDERVYRIVSPDAQLVKNEVAPARGVIIMIASATELEDEIARLRDLDLRGLRARWHSVFRRKTPRASASPSALPLIHCAVSRRLRRPERFGASAKAGED